ncbi:deleted in malignant brain tumors 1 protein-like [Halichondria panicea]|uniref:deleted in malignant brain tumors 1 protein-like n=1 Tax=Halichondria panicea TaxID=6063 RepID=UPI00312B4F8D
MKTLYTLLVPVIVSVAVAIDNPQNGDIRLSGLVDRSSLKGRLEVYNSTTDVWGTVCYTNDIAQQNWEKGAARAACRQLGYQDVISVGSVTQLNVLPAPETTPILLYEVSCVYNTDVSNLNNEMEHILRCDFSEEGSCNHTQDMAIECSNTSKYASPYSAEVRLVGGDYRSHGVLEVYVNDIWGTVCPDSVTASSAQSACRQMGYTGANSFSQADPLKDTQLVIQTLTCSSSRQCLGFCFYYPSATDTVTCFSDAIVAITCTFDLQKKYLTPGNEDTCEASTSPTVPPLNWIVRLAETIGGGVGGLALVLILIITTLCCCCFTNGCPLHSWRERRLFGVDGYEKIN